MKMHGIDMVGKFLFQEVATKPVWTAADKRRGIYVTDENKYYFGGNSTWQALPVVPGGIVGSVTDTVDPTPTDDSYDLGTIWINTTADTYFICTDITPSNAVWVGSGGGSGLSEITIKPNDFILDEDYDTVSSGAYNGLIETMDFRYDEDGGIVTSVPFPDGWTDTSDINIDLVYNCNGDNDLESIAINTYTWSVDNGDTTISPELSGADNIATDLIQTSSSNIGTIAETTLTNGKFPASSLTSNTKSLVLYIMREGNSGSDTYDGTFQLTNVKLSQ